MNNAPSRNSGGTRLIIGYTSHLHRLADLYILVMLVDVSQ
jgi:hypothetical protein